MSDTIFALSSGPLPSGVAVLRISGPCCRSVAAALCGALPAPRTTALRKLRDPETGELLDTGLILWFPAPSSFTGEDVLELHLHGSRAVVSAVLQRLGQMPELRMADAGEFTRRAFLNGRMDLTEAEGLADLLEAQTEAQRRQALRQAEGALSRAAAGWRSELVDLMAMLASQLDFADEGDVESLDVQDLLGRFSCLASSLEAAVASARQGEIIREGATVVLAGPPNAGKSSLLNALARRDVALVSPHAGTTRDSIEVTLDLRGVPVVFVDTAGLRETEDPVESMGIERTKARAQRADVVLWLSEDLAPPPSDLTDSIRVRTKCDLSSGSDSRALAVSALAGAGLQGLLDVIYERVAALCGSVEPALVTQERQRRLVQRASGSLRRINVAMPAEVMAEQLRIASVALDTLVGRIDVEEVLGAVFGRFCIGK